MQNPRRYVQRIQPQQAQTFDQHFWPVLVAVCVLCGIAFGAILTLLQGPWMWGSLLLLPALAALSIFLLYRLDDKHLRRSLQLAILVSLAVHLLILIYASVTFVFQNNYQFPKQQIVKRPSKTVNISNRQIPYVFRETNQQDVPEPKIEVEKEQPTVVSQPQPIPVEKQTPQLSPQIVRREQPAKTVPRLGQQLSQLRRQTQNLKPQSSAQADVQTAAQKQPSQPTESESKVTVSREASSSQAAKSSNQAAEQTESTALADRSVLARMNRQSKPQQTDRSLESDISSSARIRKSSPQIPNTEPRLSLPVAAAVPKQEKRTENQPAKSANSVLRRPNTSSVAQPRRIDESTTELSPQAQVARTAERRPQQTPPAISNPQSTTTVAKRSSINAPSPTSNVAVESPNRAPDSNRQSRELNAKTLSVSRGENGIAGSGISRNLERDLGGAPSPAITASDSASRRRAESRPASNEMLSSTQKSDARRSTAQSRTPTSAFKANTNLTAKISGSRSPATETMEASAATVDSSSAEHRSEVAAEKGEASVDLGPTKLVADQSAQRRSGGGQPDVAELSPELTRRSSSRSNNQMPSLATNAIAPASAPATAESAPQSSDEPQPSVEAIAHARTGGDNVITREESTAFETGTPLDQGDSRLAELLADARQRAKKDQPLDASLTDDDEDEQQTGNMNTRLAQAPRVHEIVGLGDVQQNNSTRDTPNEALGEAVASTVIERAAGTIAGSLTRGTARQLLGAAALMPVTDSGATTQSAQRAARQANSNSLEGLGDSATSRSRSNDRSPILAKTGAESPSFQQGESRSEISMEATDVAVDRTADSSPGAAMDVLAPEGAAGLEELLSRDLGLPTRPASRESEQIAMESATRFRSERFGASPAVSPDATIAKEAFRSRQPSSASGGRPSNERAINLGLEFLARHQSPDGSWSLTGFDRNHSMYNNQLDCDSAATGLALLAFQGAGYNHREFKYAQQVKHAIDWLVDNQSQDGGLFVETGTRSDEYCRLYAHGIAALALTEAYGMTQDPDLKEPAQRALDFIAETQDPKHGGWRYYTKMADRQTDTSVTGWMMMALQSGRLAGLDVRRETFDGIDGWLEMAADSDNPSQFRYNPFSPDTSNANRAQGRASSPPMTAVGLLMRIYSGWDRQDPRLLQGARSLVDRQMPSDANILSRDTYYWYYATQVLLHVDGPLWESWESQLHPLLVQSQIQTGEMMGSWDPYSPVPDRWGVHAGRLYVTTMNLLSLEVKNRKLPLYDDTLKGSGRKGVDETEDGE